jgi:MFS family permease
VDIERSDAKVEMIKPGIRDIISKNFVLTFLAHFFFAVGFHSLLPTLPLYLAELKFNDTEIGIIIGAFAISALLSRPVSGVALQRYTHKYVIALGCGIFSLTMIAFLFVTGFWMLFLIRVFQGASFAFVTTASFALIVDISPPARRGQGLAYFLLSANIAMVVAPSFGMFLINLFSFSTLFITLFIISVAALITIWALKADGSHESAEPIAKSNSLICRPAIPSSIVSLGQQFGWGAISAFFPLYAVQKGVVNPGLFFGAMAVSMLVCRAFGSNLINRYNPRNLIVTLITGTIIGVVLLACFGTLALFILAGLILGAANAFMMPTLMDFAVRRAGSSSNAAVATFMGLSDLGMALGPVIMGVLANSFGYSIMFFCLAFTSALNLLYSSIALKENE